MKPLEKVWNHAFQDREAPFLNKKGNTKVTFVSRGQDPQNPFPSYASGMYICRASVGKLSLTWNYL